MRTVRASVPDLFPVVSSAVALLALLASVTSGLAADPQWDALTADPQWDRRSAPIGVVSSQDPQWDAALQPSA